MMNLSGLEIQQLLETAEAAALQAGVLLRDRVAQPRQLSQKGFRDLVTDADIAAQKVITTLIHGRFPDHGYLSEEDDPGLRRDGPVIWVIDPVDGTTNYSRQQPNFSISIAAALREGGEGEIGSGGDKGTRRGGGGEVVVGVVYDPMRDELFSGAVGQGSRANGRSIQVSPVAAVGEAVIALDWGRSDENRTMVLAAVERYGRQVHSIRSIGSAALGLAWVAAGRLDAYIQYALGPWDAAAASVLIREAGGQITTINGQPWTLAARSCVASNGRIQQTFLDVAPDSL
jgi:myo-inositol-1(or 4)-monophosphatase